MNSQPSESFVPLTAAPVAPGKREFRVAVLNAPDHPGAGAANRSTFHSLEPSRPVAGNSVNRPEKKPCEPRVTVQRDGNRVTHLRIQCTCGQIMDLACVYDEAPPANAAS